MRFMTWRLHCTICGIRATSAQRRTVGTQGMRQRGFLKEAPLDSPKTFNAFFRGANMVR